MLYKIVVDGISGTGVMWPSSIIEGKALGYDNRACIGDVRYGQNMAVMRREKVLQLWHRLA